MLMEEAKIINNTICTALKEVDNKQIALDTLLSSIETSFEGIFLENINSYDYERETK